MNEQVDLSKFNNGEIRDLYWALYDLNTAVLKLISAGLADNNGTCNIDETMSRLEAELTARRMRIKRKNPSLNVQTWGDVPLDPPDKIGADF